MWVSIKQLLMKNIPSYMKAVHISRNYFLWKYGEKYYITKDTVGPYLYEDLNWTELTPETCSLQWSSRKAGTGLLDKYNIDLDPDQGVTGNLFIDRQGAFLLSNEYQLTSSVNRYSAYIEEEEEDTVSEYNQRPDVPAGQYDSMSYRKSKLVPCDVEEDTVSAWNEIHKTGFRSNAEYWEADTSLGIYVKNPDTAFAKHEPNITVGRRHLKIYDQDDTFIADAYQIATGSTAVFYLTDSLEGYFMLAKDWSIYNDINVTAAELDWQKTYRTIRIVKKEILECAASLWGETGTVYWYISGSPQSDDNYPVEGEIWLKGSTFAYDPDRIPEGEEEAAGNKFTQYIKVNQQDTVYSPAEIKSKITKASSEDFPEFNMRILFTTLQNEW